ncbi:MAG: hypothetical protein MUC81_11535 [Bacteroidia bacterium]|jgi:hypothetical protein|nr:hypothetical protein [Bacteroidia bacterium]
MKYKLAIIIFLFIACKKSNYNEKTFFKDPKWVLKIVNENNCVNEYEFAKLIVNAFSYNQNCLDLFCFNHKHIPTTNGEPMNQFRIQLDTSRFKSGLVKSGDTIEFCFILVNRNSCFCSDRLDHYPSNIAIKRGTNSLISIGDGAVTLHSIENDTKEILGNPKMLNYIKQNRDSIDPWFYKQLMERGYLR